MVYYAVATVKWSDGLTGLVLEASTGHTLVEVEQRFDGAHRLDYYEIEVGFDCNDFGYWMTRWRDLACSVLYYRQPQAPRKLGARFPRKQEGPVARWTLPPEVPGHLSILGLTYTPLRFDRLDVETFWPRPLQLVS